MEIEPDVVNVAISQALIHLRHLSTNAILAALLVDQVDPVLLRVVFLSLLDVLLSGLEALIEVWIDGDRRCPSHRRLHLPDQWNAASYLQVTRDGEATIGFLLRYNVLSLAEVCGVALAIEATHDESATHTTSIFPRDQHEACACIDRLDRDEAVDAGHTEWSVLHFDELF